MRIEDAILHCEEVAERCHLPGCAADHRQLAEWLKELKHRRENSLDGHYEKPGVDDKNPKRYLCGNCGTAVSGVWRYCQHCGVRIDWSEVNDETKNL